MAADSIDFAKGESPMTDLQFSAYVELRDKYEALLELRCKPPNKIEEAASDYQFKRYEELRDRYDDLNNEVMTLRRENARLKLQVDMFKSSTSKRYQL